jgi:hypothetical protein
MRGQQNISERVAPMRLPRSLPLTTALLAGCPHAPTEHVCSNKQLVSAVKPPHSRRIPVTVDPRC